jgi:hydroxypyruvate reductase 1
VSVLEWRTHNPSGLKRIIVTKELPGDRWLKIFDEVNFRVEVCTSTNILSISEIKSAIGDQCDGAIGQLTEKWGEDLFSVLAAAGGKAYSNYAVGYNNVDVAAANKHGVAVGNTPGVLTETTTEMTVTLTLAAARRVVEADTFMRAGHYTGWLPSLFLGERLIRKTVGVVGAGRIGSAYARTMVEGFKMDLIYHDLQPNIALEDYIKAYSVFLESRGERPVSCKRASSVEELLQASNVISLHPVLNETTRHLINVTRLNLMKPNAILINASRGPVIDESALVAHCQKHPEFRAGLDVFEDEPRMHHGLAELNNVVIVPHIASATSWTRQGMATLAASNVAGILRGYPAWQDYNITTFLESSPPNAAPSIVNAEAIGIPPYHN